ncbi:MAG: glycosyltransferase family 4 protein [Pseudomonadota bacterium]
MTNRNRILFFSSGLAPEYGGAAISEASLCKSLSDQVDVQVACREDRWNRKFIRDFSLKNPSEYSPKDFYSCWRDANHAIRSWFEGVSVVHLNGHWRWEYYFISKICQELSIPYVLHPRGMMLVAGRKVQLKKVFNHLIGQGIAQNAHKVIALSHFEIEQLKPYDLSDEQVVVIPNGVCGAKETEQPHEASSLSDHFLYFGRLEHRKNLLFLLEAYSKYRQLGGNKKLRLKGPTEHGYEQLILKKIEELQLGHHISILAPTYGQDKWRHLNQAIAVIYPCLDEPFGRVPFETLLSGGFPIVPSESGGAEYLKSILPDSIYPTDQINSLAERMIWSEKISLEIRDSILKKARQWVLNQLDWSKISNQILNVYESAMQERPSSKRLLSPLFESYP